MKQILFFSALLLVSVGTATAQHARQKVGFVNTDSVLVALPEFKTQQKILESYAKQQTNNFETMQRDFESKRTFLVQNQENLTMREIKEKQQELQDIYGKLQNFEKEAQFNLMKKEQELISPLSVKIRQGIEQIGKEGQFDAILPASQLLFFAPAEDLTQKVIQKVSAN